MFNVKPVRVELGAVDWFQLSWPKKDEAYYGAAFYEKQLELQRAGFPIRPDRRAQYRGGTASGVFAGSSEQGGFVEARGAVANACFQGARALGGGRCSRIDIQITIQLGASNEGIAAACGAATMERYKAGKRGAPKVCPIIGQEGAGWTQYLGAPSSNKMARVYDKGAQKGLAKPGLVWRFELQYRRRYAQKVYEQLCSLDAYQVYIAQVIRGQFISWGIDIDFGDLAPCEVVFGRKPQTDDEKALAWLRVQIGPSVARLLGSTVGPQVAALIAEWATMAAALDNEITSW